MVSDKTDIKEWTWFDCPVRHEVVEGWRPEGECPKCRKVVRLVRREDYDNLQRRLQQVSGDSESMGLTQWDQLRSLEDKVARYERALIWIAESGRVLRHNEHMNEPFLFLIQNYRNHEVVARKALSGSQS